MSMQLYLVFDSNEKCRYIAEKYQWTEDEYEIIDTEEHLQEHCVCAYYGESGFTHGIGEYECIIAAEQKNFIPRLHKHKLISRTDNEEAAEMTHVYRDTILEDIANWSVFIRENIDVLNGIGFLPHWDVCDFSGVVFEKKPYSQAELIDLLTVREDVVLWIYSDK